MKEQRGSIFIYLLIILILLSILSIGVFNISYSAVKGAQFIQDNNQAYYLAKSGVESIISNIDNIIEEMDEDNMRTYTMKLSEGTAIIDVEIIKKDNELEKVHIDSLGKANGSKSKIQANLTKEGKLEESILILGDGEKLSIKEMIIVS